MANTPVAVKQSMPAANPPPDIWRSLRTEMDRLFDNFTGRFGMMPMFPPRYETGFSVPSPAVDITENESAFTLTAEIPAMTEKEVQVSLSGGTLTVTGEKRQEREEKNENRYLSERSYGSFQRSFLLPDSVDSEKVNASFANGVLTITLPKLAKATTKKIEVKAAA